MVAWYSSADDELPAKKVTVNGDRIEMSLSTITADGENIDVTFLGVLNGDRVSGDVDWSTEGDSGSFPFQGERKP